MIVGVGVTVTDDDVPPPDKVIGMLTGVPLGEVTLPVTLIGEKLEPAASESLRVQVTVAKTHVHPFPEMPETAKPVGGSDTVTVPLVAPLPVSETVIV